MIVAEALGPRGLSGGFYNVLSSISPPCEIRHHIGKLNTHALQPVNSFPGSSNELGNKPCVNPPQSETHESLKSLLLSGRHLLPALNPSQLQKDPCSYYPCHQLQTVSQARSHERSFQRRQQPPPNTTISADSFSILFLPVKSANQPYYTSFYSFTLSA
jgi:hypothetical protein